MIKREGAAAVEEQQSHLFRHPPAAAQKEGGIWFCFCLYG
jgi:hypothetical protein